MTNTVKFIKWVFYVPAMLLVTALTFPLAFVLPLFAEEREGLMDNNTKLGRGAYLPGWLSWFQTPDNSLDGDEGWRTEHWQWRFKLPEPFCTYIGRIGWLWRNPGYGFGLVQITERDCVSFTCDGDPNVSDNTTREGWFYIETPSYWQLRYIKRVSDTRCVYLNLGWNIQGALLSGKSQICSFAFSPRLVRVAV